jgi:hydrogenase nickel incorporation protein HypA/HybF
MNSLMDRILKVAKDNEATKVVRIDVWLGALSHMSPGHFGEHYEESAKGTIAEGAELCCETSEDINDPNAQDILLKNIEVED